MPYADNNGIRIHYHLEGEGPPLALMHGAGGGFETWYDFGYVNALMKEYQLVLMDGRGYGKSDKPHDPKDYDVRLRVADIVAVLDETNVDKAHFYGYSMGGRIGWGIAKYAPKRFHSLTIGGMSPYKPDKAGWDELDRQASTLRQGMKAALAEAEAVYGRLPQEFRDNFLANDAEALWASKIEARDWSGAAEDLPNINMPCLVIVGEADHTRFSGAKEGVKHIPDVTFVSLPGLNHFEAGRIDVVLPHIREFLKRVGQTSATPA